jgi:methyl-coenzyme M reductase beta subunit
VADKIDLYSDRGAKLKGDVDLSDISPLRNTAIKKIIHDTKRTAAVDLAGIEKALATGRFGGKGRQVPKKAMNFDVVKNADKLVAKVADLVRQRWQTSVGTDTICSYRGRRRICGFPDMCINGDHTGND